MKSKLLSIAGICLFLLLVNCRNGQNANQAQADNPHQEQQIEQIEESSDELESATQDIETKEAELEAALKELEDIDNR